MKAGPRSARIGRLVRSVDFERVLRTRTRSHSDHFAVHHLDSEPSVAPRPRPAPAKADLSTGEGTNLVPSVDDLPLGALETTLAAPEPNPARPRLWLGTVVPKRHARRAVTRTLLKRQMHAAVALHMGSMARGLWVVRLRAEFDRKRFDSAASAALQRAAREELDRLLQACVEAAVTSA